MKNRRVGAYGGIAGHVLVESFSITTALTALILSGALGVVVLIAVSSRQPIIVSVGFPAVMSFAFARFALNGQAGEWQGSIISSAGGDWRQVAWVAGRFNLVMTAWSIPLVLLSVAEAATTGGETTSISVGPMPMPHVPVLVMIYMVTVLIALPVALIVSVEAQSVRECFSAALWRSIFPGRFGDLLALCSLSAGAPVVIYFLALPLMVGMMASHPLGATVAGVIVMAVVGALWATLFGRLCGSFARGDMLFDLDPAIAGEQPGSGNPRPGVARSAGSGPAVRITSNAPPRTQAPPPAGPPPLPGAVSPAASVPAAPAAPASIPLSADPAGEGPPLLEAETRVAMAEKQFESDPNRGIEALEALRREFAPAPLVLCSLAGMLRSSGQVSRGAELCREAIPLCVQKGEAEQAAGLYQLFHAELADMTLEREERLAIAGALKPMGQLTLAAKTYAAVVREDPTESRAIKGLVQVAEMMQKEEAQVPNAAKILEYLLQAAPHSPLAPYVQESLDRLQLKMAHA